MKIVFATLLSTAALAAFGAAAFVYFGVFNVAATDQHWPASYWLMEKARMRSIQVRAAGLTPPAGYDEQAKVVGAVAHFSEHCATCHGGPGTRRNEIADGMYPEPPDLTNAAAKYTPGELFWILKNGIKMSAMPSMASDGDDMLWSTVAFLQKLPTMSNDDYNDLWMASQAQGGMHMDHGTMTMTHGSMNMGGTPPEEGAASGNGGSQASGARPPGSPNAHPTRRD